MSQTTTVPLKNGTITLPLKFQKILEGVREVCIIPAEKAFIIKPIEKSLKKLSGLASRVSTPRMETREIQEEIQEYRKTQ